MNRLLTPTWLSSCSTWQPRSEVSEYTRALTLAQVVTFALETRNVIATLHTSDLCRNLLPTLLEQLEVCQKSLTAYLETKRAEFPRFYFVSDPTLLEILSLGSDPPSVVPHFQSGLFDSLTGVTFDKVSKTRQVATIFGFEMRHQMRVTAKLRICCCPIHVAMKPQVLSHLGPANKTSS